MKVNHNIHINYSLPIVIRGKYIKYKSLLDKYTCKINITYCISKNNDNMHIFKKRFFKKTAFLDEERKTLCTDI
jgi:hypothetical protein